MKKKLSKILIATLLFASMAGITPTMAASEVAVPKTSDAVIMPFSDQWIAYYRSINGVKQYRLWNATQGEWVTDWINY